MFRIMDQGFRVQDVVCTIKKYRLKGFRGWVSGFGSMCVWVSLFEVSKRTGFQCVGFRVTSARGAARGAHIVPLHME